MKCSFCQKHIVEAKSGKTTCPECSAVFKIDDRLECIFADTSKMRLPMNGAVCGMCGLVQGDARTLIGVHSRSRGWIWSKFLLETRRRDSGNHGFRRLYARLTPSGSKRNSEQGRRPTPPLHPKG